MPEKMKVSDAVALFLKEKGIKHVFGIVGAANSHIFDSIEKLGYTQIVCVHHEQAATMAMQTYYRTNGQVTAALVTAGGGSTNAITGVLSAWADSIPGIVISGQENAKYVETMGHMRMYGIQGYDSTAMVEKITKYQARVMQPNRTLLELEKCYRIASEGRPGPVWIDFPMNIQGAVVETNAFEKEATGTAAPLEPKGIDIQKVLELLMKAERPVIWAGNGIRLSKAEAAFKKLLASLPVPTILSWAGLDLMDTDHPLHFGRAGNYGNRSANFVVQNSDLILALGTRLAIPMIGYEHQEFARKAQVVMVDVDSTELEKLNDRLALGIHADVGRFMAKLQDALDRKKAPLPGIQPWMERCEGYRRDYPLLGPENPDQNGYINSYRFVDRLSSHLKPDQHITTDMGTALLSGHAVIRLNGTQRIMTSTGLGEMGYGLPAAIGVSFARERGEVMCLNCDGGIMMNLQEFQTVVHYKLPIKIFIFNNRGYLMIKHTQKNLFKGHYVGSDLKDVSFPNFKKIAEAFDMPHYEIRTWEDFDRVIPEVQSMNRSLVCEVHMDPEQYFYPKLGLAMGKDGKIVSPPLEDLSPLLPREEIRRNMIVGMHPKSEGLD